MQENWAYQNGEYAFATDCPDEVFPPAMSDPFNPFGQLILVKSDEAVAAYLSTADGILWLAEILYMGTTIPSQIWICQRSWLESLSDPENVKSFLEVEPCVGVAKNS